MSRSWSSAPSLHCLPLAGHMVSGTAAHASAHAICTIYSVKCAPVLDTEITVVPSLSIPAAIMKTAYSLALLQTIHMPPSWLQPHMTHLLHAGLREDSLKTALGFWNISSYESSTYNALEEFENGGDPVVYKVIGCKPKYSMHATACCIAASRWPRGIHNDSIACSSCSSPTANFFLSGSNQAAGSLKRTFACCRRTLRSKTWSLLELPCWPTPLRATPHLQCSWSRPLAVGCALPVACSCFLCMHLVLSWLLSAGCNLAVHHVAAHWLGALVPILTFLTAAIAIPCYEVIASSSLLGLACCLIHL